MVNDTLKNREKWTNATPFKENNQTMATAFMGKNRQKSNFDVSTLINTN